MGLERCIEITWEILMLFTLYNVLGHLFLKPGHEHCFQDVGTGCIQSVFGRCGSCWCELFLSSTPPLCGLSLRTGDS